MTVDELKVVLEMVATVSGDAKMVAIWYIASGIAKYLIIGGVVGFAIVTLIKSVVRNQISNVCMNQVNDILKIKDIGLYYPDDYYRVVSRVAELSEQNKIIERNMDND